MARITADNFDPEAACVRLKDHKTAHKGKSRTIYLCSEAVALLLEQRAKHGGGFLFRNRFGLPFTKNAIVKAMEHLQKKVRVKASPTATGTPSQPTPWPTASRTPTSPNCLGISGTAMLHRHYAHLTARSQALREALGRVR